MKLKLKLSAAILKGSKEYPNTRKYFFHGDACCALGAAIRAVKGRQEHEPTLLAQLQAAEIWPGLLKKEFACPVLRCTLSNTLILLVSHLHSDHRWSRERIAGWVRKKGR